MLLRRIHHKRGWGDKPADQASRGVDPRLPAPAGALTTPVVGVPAPATREEGVPAGAPRTLAERKRAALLVKAARITKELAEVTDEQLPGIATIPEGTLRHRAT